MFQSAQDLPRPLFVGYFPKVTMTAPPELAAAGVSDIAAVSNCMSNGPDNWIDSWKHNELGFYDSEELALSVVPPSTAAAYDLYAYEMVPVEYAEQLQLIEVATVSEPSVTDYSFLGYDIVTRSISSFFECSPLSCNLAATSFTVNKYCLIDTLDAAYEAFLRIGSTDSGYEPGPYYLVAVYRKHRAA